METFEKVAPAEIDASFGEVEELGRKLELWANDLEIQTRVALRFRHQAAEVRLQSYTARDPVVRQLLLVLAADYERLAQRVDYYEYCGSDTAARVA